MPINQDILNTLVGGGASAPATTGVDRDWDAIASILGQTAGAIGGPESWQGRAGSVAAGTAQSRKLAQAAEKQSKERRSNWGLVRNLLEGGITPQGIPGVSSAKLTGNKGGGLPELTLSITPEQEAYKSLFGVTPLKLGSMTEGSPSPFPTSSAGISAADLAGLTPEQIMAVTKEQRAGEELGLGTFANIMRIVEGRKPAPTPEQFTTYTDELGRVYSQNMLTGETRQVSGVPRLTLEEQKELATTGQVPVGVRTALTEAQTEKALQMSTLQGDWWKDPDTGQVEWVNRGENPPVNWIRVPSREQVPNELPRERFEFTKGRSVITAGQNIRMNPKNEAVKSDIGFHNKYSTGNTGFFWRSEKKKWARDINEATEVELPIMDGKQVTMEDIRAEAAERGISPEKVLEEVYDAMHEGM
jgi:hypothetical protein